MHTLLYVCVLVPLLVFAGIYAGMYSEKITPPLPDLDTTLLIVLGIIALCDWILAIVIFRRAMAGIRLLKSLGEKLERYTRATYSRFVLLTAGALILAIGFYLTGANGFPGVFSIGLIIMSMVWPLPRRVCADLHLTGEERRLVIYQEDSAPKR